ncbi:MAG: hypothetical protein WD572_08510 [Gammaproteobacteria bacterium]
MQLYPPGSTLILVFDDDDHPHLLFHLDSQILLALAARLNTHPAEAALLAVRALHRVLLDRVHYFSPDLVTYLHQNDSATPTARQALNGQVLEFHGRRSLELVFDDGPESTSSCPLQRQQLRDLARYLNVSQAMATKAAISCLHRALVEAQAYLSPGLRKHICQTARLAGPATVIDSLYWQLGLKDRAPWES